MSGAQLSVQTTEAAETWSWGLRPHALGVGMRMIALGSPYAGEARQDTLTNLYDIPWLLAGRQPAGLVEWFHNDRAGLRQNFTIAARPPGSRSDSLTLQLAQEGDLQADLLAGGHGLRLYDAEGAAVLSYDRLYVFDADGRSLDAWFELGHGLAIVVDDAEARYPITIDPVTTAAAGPAIVAGEATGSSFGAVVASAGDVNGDGFDDLAVGAPGFNGSTGKVYVFHGSASGVTSTAANPSFSVTGEAAANYFGETVEGAGDVNGDGYDDLAVGTSRANNYGGKVYVFLGSATGLSGTAANPAFSASRPVRAVASAGDVNGDGFDDLAIGAPGGEGPGSVAVFLGSAIGLQGIPAFSLYGEDGMDEFGISLARAGDVNGDGFDDLAVGAPGNNNHAGKIYVFHGGPSGFTGPQAAPAFSATGEAAYNNFGTSLGGTGDLNGDGFADLAVGASGFGSSSGKVYVFHGSAGGISGTASSPAFSITGEANSSFGSSVATASDVNGDGFDDLAVRANYGFFIFHGSAAGITGTTANPAFRTTSSSGSFTALASIGDVNGDSLADLAAGVSSDGGTGAVYFYYGRSDPSFSVTGEKPFDFFGISVAAAGDVNGDGYADLAVGAVGAGPSDLSGTSGKVYVFHGGPTGLSGTAAAPAFSVTGQTGGFGRVVASAGDVNGDGYDDLAVGAGTLNELTGKIYVFYGGAAGLTGTAAAPAFSVTGEGTYDAFGADVASAGDVNGDGYSDLAVGAPTWGSNQGKVYVFHGSAGGLTGTAASPAFSVTGETAGDEFGSSVAGIRDVNGDGYADLAVGAYRYNSETGKVYVFAGSATGITGTAAAPAFSAAGQAPGSTFGTVVAAAGDVNGDTFADLAVGTGGAHDNTVGKVYVFHGSAAGLTGTVASPAFSAVGEAASNNFGAALAGGGDRNRDGFDDLTVGAKGYNGRTGKVYIFGGSAGGLTGTPAAPAFSAGGEAVDDEFGISVANAGDLNGDGAADLVVGASGYGNSRGRVYVFHAGGPVLKTLSVSKNGSGRITSNPAGIDCGATCTADFGQGTDVVLTANPDPGYTFSGWSGACVGASTCAVTMDAAKSVTAGFSQLAGPQAQPDTAVTIQGASLLIDVLANDVPGASPDLTLYALTQPASGGAVAIEQNKVRFTPAPGSSGSTSFGYTVRDANGWSSSAGVTVTVVPSAGTSGQPQVIPLPDPAAGGVTTITTPAGGTTIQIPGGAITATGAAFDFVYAEMVGPITPSTGLQPAGRTFSLQLFADAQPQAGYVFAKPILLTLAYDPSLVADPTQLVVYYYNVASGQWSSDGIEMVGVDTINKRFTIRVAHLTLFAAFARVDEQIDLYLPQITRH